MSLIQRLLAYPGIILTGLGLSMVAGLLIATYGAGIWLILKDRWENRENDGY